MTTGTLVSESRVKPFILRGGLYDTWEGEFYDQGEDFVFWGPEEGYKTWAYKKTGRVNQEGRVEFRFNKKASVAKMRECHYAEEAIQELISPIMKNHEKEVLNNELAIFKVVTEKREKEWVMVVDGEDAAALPLDAIADKEAARDWVASVMGVGAGAQTV